MVRFTTWKEAGINYIVDIIDNNSKIASPNLKKHKYGINIKQLEYQSIPKQWKKTITQTQNIRGTNVPDTCCLKIGHKHNKVQEIATRDIYTHIIEAEKSATPTSTQRWIDTYDDMELNEDYWALIYDTPFLLTQKAVNHTFGKMEKNRK